MITNNNIESNSKDGKIVSVSGVLLTSLDNLSRSEMTRGL